MRKNTSAAAKATRLFPFTKGVIDRQTLQQRSNRGCDAVLLPRLLSEQCGLQRPGIAHARRTGVTLHQHRVDVEHIGHGQAIVRHHLLLQLPKRIPRPFATPLPIKLDRPMLPHRRHMRHQRPIAHRMHREPRRLAPKRGRRTGAQVQHDLMRR